MQGVKGNEYTVADGVAFIDVSTPKIKDVWAVVDQADLGRLLEGKGRWSAVEGVSALYAVRRGRLMHREVLRLQKGGIVDHISGDGLDNRRENIRVGDYTMNARNRRLRCDNKTGYPGVRWSNRIKRFRVTIKRNGKNEALGSFKDFIDAVAVRKVAEIGTDYHQNHGRGGFDLQMSESDLRARAAKALAGVGEGAGRQHYILAHPKRLKVFHALAMSGELHDMSPVDIINRMNKADTKAPQYKHPQSYINWYQKGFEGLKEALKLLDLDMPKNLPKPKKRKAK